jgi:multiple sugar transport system permease protein
MYNKLTKTQKTIIHILLIAGSLIMVLPFVWMILTAGKTIPETTSIPPTLLPDSFQWENFTRAWNALPFLDFFKNTFLMIIVRVITTTIFSTMAAFALAKLEFPGKKLFFWMVLTQLMIPPQIYMTPHYLYAQNLGLLDTVAGLIMPGVVSAFGTFLLRQYYMQLPDELMEAAIIDGASIWQVFWKVYFPLAKSGIVALGIFTALNSYKSLMWPLVVNISQEKLPLSAGLALLQESFLNDYPLLMAGTVISVVPIIILYIFFQRQFEEGISTTGGK